MTRATACPGAGGLPLLVALALLSAPTASRASTSLAILLGKNLKTSREAAAALEKMSGVKSEVFRLYEGTRELDRTVRGLKSGRYDRVVSLGASAHDFFREAIGLPYAATLVLTPDEEEGIVEMEPPPEEWAAVMASLLPAGSVVATIDSRGDKRAYLVRLREALKRRGLRLRVDRVGRGQAVSSIAGKSISSARGFFFPRTRELLNKKAAVSILKAAHARAVPIFAFSQALVKAGALLCLEVSPGELARIAYRRAGGEPEGRSPSLLYLNRERAKVLRITVPGEILKRARTE